MAEMNGPGGLTNACSHDDSTSIRPAVGGDSMVPICIPRQTTSGLGGGYWAIRDYDAAVTETHARAAESATDIQGYEGGQRLRYVNTYEREPALRAAAILSHGVIRKGCAFEFGAMYGELGRGYIEVHHLRPLSAYSGRELVSPCHDMTVLCSNCHRMVHRKPDTVLSITDLRNIITFSKQV